MRNVLKRFSRSHTDQKLHGIFLFAILALCILTASLVFFILSIGKPYMGVTLSIIGRYWIVSSVDPNGLAIQSGIGIGDRPIEINGQSASIFLEKYVEAGTIRGPLITDLTVTDQHNQLKSVVLESSSPSQQTVMELITYFLTCLIFWIIGFYVFLKKRRDIAARLLCLCGLFFGLVLSANAAGERLIPTAFWFAVIATAVGPWVLVHFFLVLPEERARLRSNPKVYLIYAPAVITLILYPIVGYADEQPVQWFRTLRLLESILGLVTAVGVAIFSYVRSASVKTRQQMKIMLIGCLAALIPFLALYLVPEIVSSQTPSPAGFSILFLVFIPLGMGYAVVTQKLMDIDIVIRRGMIYGLVTIIMAALISIAIFLVAISHESVSTPLQILTALILGGLAAVLFGPVKKRIEILIDRFFYKDRYDYRQVIQSLSNAFNSVYTLSDISRLIVGTVVNTLNLSGGCLFIKTQSDSLEVVATQGTFIEATKQEYLRKSITNNENRNDFPNLVKDAEPEIAFMVRLVTGEQQIGVLCLSQKMSRQHFSSDDLYLIQGISSVSSIALYSAMLIRDVSMRDAFVSIASHELRTPLTAITGYADLLLRRNPSEATKRRWIQNILDNGQSISAMANDLLNVTRIQSGKISLKLERVKLCEIFDAQLNIIRENTDIHKFIVDIKPPLLEVIVDRDKFGQVIANLLSNAVKYSPKGGSITLSGYNSPSHNRIIVSISDEGIGIGQEDKKSLFTTFHRIQRPETQRIRGSGLGLFIAKEWTGAMGGNIWVESELNRGSKFFISLPTQLDYTVHET